MPWVVAGTGRGKQATLRDQPQGSKRDKAD